MFSERQIVSSNLQMFFEIVVLKNFTNFAGKHLCCMKYHGIPMEIELSYILEIPSISNEKLVFLLKYLLF